MQFLRERKKQCEFVFTYVKSLQNAIKCQTLLKTFTTYSALRSFFVVRSYLNKNSVLSCKTMPIPNLGF